MWYLQLNQYNFHLDPVPWIEIRVSKPQSPKFPRKVEVPQRLDERHMDEEFEPAGLSRCGKLVEELSHVNHERGEHPTYGKDSPLGVVMVQVSVIQGQIDQEGIYISAYVHRRQHWIEKDKLANLNVTHVGQRHPWAQDGTST